MRTGDLYKYKNQQYVLIQEASMKHPASGEWVSCVLYRAIAKFEVYVREKEDFVGKFELVTKTP